MAEITIDGAAATSGWLALWHDADRSIEIYGSGRLSGADENWQYQTGWCVAFYDCQDGYKYVVPLAFGRKQDAEAAARAVESMAKWPPTVAGVAAKLKEIGTKSVRRCMIEALQW